MAAEAAGGGAARVEPLAALAAGAAAASEEEEEEEERLPANALPPLVTTALRRSKDELRPLRRFTGTLALAAASAVAAAAAANSWNLEELRALSTHAGARAAPPGPGWGAVPVAASEVAPALVHGCAAAAAALMRWCGARHRRPSSSGRACGEREAHTGEVKAGGTLHT